ncbi:MAG: peptidylprolyl isomerase [Planctomycetes bacterium]|nr:peptidylprolyl isomerase [Planctomycetota bacterium]
MHPLRFLAIALLALACRQENPQSVDSPVEDAQPPVFVSDQVQDSELGQFHVILEVSIEGQALTPMTLRMAPELAPKTVRNFLRISESGFYDGLVFHRVLRQFMVQGGCEVGNGSGSGPFSPIPGEFSSSEAARHVYGTLSMARGNSVNSAGAQFFIICDDGPAAWSLDGKYASFATVVSGGDALEAIAGVPVQANPRGEPSVPTRRIEIVNARVVRGALPDAVTISPVTREQDTPGWPNTVEVQTLLVAVGGGLLPVKRTLPQAETLAEELLARAQSGEDFDDLVREYSDDPAQKGSVNPVGYRFANEGSHPKEGQREVFNLNNEYQERFNQLGVSKRQGLLSPKEVSIAARKFQVDMGRFIRTESFIPRAQKRVLADAAFKMEIGDIQVLPRDPARTLEGYYLIRRVR